MKKNSTPKKGGKANKTARGGTPPAGGAARRAVSPTITGLNGDDDPVIEQVLQNQETIGELMKKTSSMEGSLQRILVLLEKKQAEGDGPRTTTTTTTTILRGGVAQQQAGSKVNADRHQDDVTSLQGDVTTWRAA